MKTTSSLQTAIPEDVLIYHCAPTLAGLKTGNIFTLKICNRKELNTAIRRMNRNLGVKGLRLIPLRFSEKSAILYLYRPNRLSQDLQDPCAKCLLERQAYDMDAYEEEQQELHGTRCVRQLIQRLQMEESFPHEIGLFLGYPPHDVEGFMNKEECQCVGCWKVYRNREAAEKTFARYHKCQTVYTKHWKQGRSVERLAVAM